MNLLLKSLPYLTKFIAHLVKEINLDQVARLASDHNSAVHFLTSAQLVASLTLFSEFRDKAIEVGTAKGFF